MTGMQKMLAFRVLFVLHMQVNAELKIEQATTAAALLPSACSIICLIQELRGRKSWTFMTKKIIFLFSLFESLYFLWSIPLFPLLFSIFCSAFSSSKPGHSCVIFSLRLKVARSSFISLPPVV